MALSNAQYKSILRGYEQIRDANRAISQARLEEAYAAIPGLRELSDSIRTLSVASARRVLEGEEHALEALHEELASVSAGRKSLLAEHGFPPDYLEPFFSCPDCQDTGYAITADGLREKCHCFRQQEIRLLYAQSHIQHMIERENFSTLSYDYYEGSDRKRFEAAVALSQDFVRRFGAEYRNLFFYGTVGTGKSFLSGCIARELLQSGRSVLYFSASGLFDTLAHYSFDSKAREAQQDFYEDFYGCDLLIIDDLGTEITNSFVTSQLFSCLNERHLRGKATLASTNLSLEELRDRYSDRIFSRISSSFTLCKLTGPDIRILKKRLANNKA